METLVRNSTSNRIAGILLVASGGAFLAAGIFGDQLGFFGVAAAFFATGGSLILRRKRKGALWPDRAGHQRALR